MNTLRNHTLTLAGLLIAGLAVLTQAPAAARGDGADWQDPDYQSYRDLQNDIISGNGGVPYGPAYDTLYAAVAYSPSTGRVGSSWSYGSVRAAKARAVRECKAADAQPMLWGKNGLYYALARGKDDTAGAAGATAAEAKALALRECGKYTTDCKVIFCFHAGD